MIQALKNFLNLSRKQDYKHDLMFIETQTHTNQVCRKVSLSIEMFQFSALIIQFVSFYRSRGNTLPATAFALWSRVVSMIIVNEDCDHHFYKSWSQELAWKRLNERSIGPECRTSKKIWSNWISTPSSMFCWLRAALPRCSSIVRKRSSLRMEKVMKIIINNQRASKMVEHKESTGHRDPSPSGVH